MYHLNTNVQKKKHDIPKHGLKHNEQGSQIFMFEITFKDNDNQTKIIRKIKKGNQGNLIQSEDNIKYSSIDYVKVAALDINNTNFEIKAKIEIDQTATYTTYMTNEIYLEFTKNTSELLECNYNIPQHQ